MAFAHPVEGRWIPSGGIGSEEAKTPPESLMDAQAPRHPVPAMQGAFEESMMETMAEVDEPEPDNRYSKADSISRRKMLLEQEKYERTVAGRWKQKPGEKFHPLWKLVAQISFGLHLLHQSLAKSDEEVIKILQNHVDEVDGFLERTTEDFDLAQDDINERIRYLQLPLEHGEVFDTMLDDRAFRMAIVDGNEKIEHIVGRTSTAMRDALKDVQKGLDGTRELARFLTQPEQAWDNRSEEHASVYVAMIGNTEGWSRAFMTLQQKGNTLGKALVQLSGIIAEIQRRAIIASRRNLVAMNTTQDKYYVEPKSHVTSPQYPASPPDSLRKDSPHVPVNVEKAIKADKPGKHIKLGLKYNMDHSFEQDVKDTLQANARLQLLRSSSKDASKRNRRYAGQESPTAAAAAALFSFDTDSGKPASTSDASASVKIPSRRVSIAERTRSLTRKLPFVKESGASKQSIRSPADQRSLQGHSPGARSPLSGVQTPGSILSIQSEGLMERTPNIPPPIDSHAHDGGRVVLPAETILLPVTPQKLGSPKQISGQYISSTTERPKVVTITSDRSVKRAHPVLRDIKVRENRVSSTAPGSPSRVASKDLPLRHYRSQEILYPPSQRANEAFKSAAVLRRVSSVRESPSTKFTPAAGSSVYSPEGQLSLVSPLESSQSNQPSSVYPTELQSNQASSIYPSEVQSSQPSSTYRPDGHQPSAELPASTSIGRQTDSPSIYSPDGPASSLYSLSLSPYTSNLSPVPAASSAAPSPLRIGVKSIPAPQNSAALVSDYLPQPAIPATTFEAPEPSDHEASDHISITLNRPPIRSKSSLTEMSDDSNATLLKGLVSPPENLVSATVSGPEPDINPYDIPRSNTTTPRSVVYPAISTPTVDDKEVIAVATLAAPPRPQFSPFPSPQVSSFAHAQSFAHGRLASPLVLTPGGLTVTPHRDFAHGETSSMEKAPRSPWKKVFGNGISMSLGSKGRGHRKSRSAGVNVAVVDGRPASRSGLKRGMSDGKTGGKGDGFMGSGKEGVWISRKNFLKT